MTNVVDGALRGSPGVEERGDVFLGVRIVALAPTRVVDGVLEIDDQERGVTGEGRGQRSGHLLIL